MLVIDHTASLGGGELALLRACAAIDPDEVELRALVLDDGPLVDRLRAAGIATIAVPAADQFHQAGRHALVGSWRGILHVGEALRLVARTIRLVRSADVDVVHTNSLRADVIGLLAASWVRVPVVWHVHDRISDDYLPVAAVRVLRALARHGPRAVVANSRATAATLPGVRDLTVVHPGFGPDQVLAYEERVAPADPRIGLIGRLSPTKGQLELVRAARAVVDREPAVRFRLIGGALFGGEEYAQRVRDEVARLGLEESVEIVDFTDDPAAQLDSLTICVHASPVPEPFGQVIVEAMVRGVPVIATDAGGVPEIVRSDAGRLGALVPPGDVDALASALTEMLADLPGAERRAALAHAEAVRRFPVQATARTLTGVWRRSAGRRG